MVMQGGVFPAGHPARLLITQDIDAALGASEIDLQWLISQQEKMTESVVCPY